MSVSDVLRTDVGTLVKRAWDVVSGASAKRIDEARSERNDQIRKRILENHDLTSGIRRNFYGEEIAPRSPAELRIATMNEAWSEDFRKRSPLYEDPVYAGVVALLGGITKLGSPIDLLARALMQRITDRKMGEKEYKGLEVLTADYNALRVPNSDALTELNRYILSAYIYDTLSVPPYRYKG